MNIIHHGNKQIQKQNYLNKIKNEKSFLKKVFLFFKMKFYMNIDNYNQNNYLSNNLKNIYILVILSIFYSQIYAQNSKKVIWNVVDKIPVQYATVKSIDNYSISNENGEFSIDNLNGLLSIQCLGYENQEINIDFFKKNDTIFLKPNVYQLEEVVLVKDDKFKKMGKAIASEFAVEPHLEKFFLRAILKRNNEFYKIIDFSGNIERKTLFDLSTKPMPKKNYKVEIKNMRKVGLENRNLDFEMFSFQKFLTKIASIYINPETIDFSSNISQDKLFTKIEFTPRDVNDSKQIGYYIVNNVDNSINEFYLYFNDDNTDFIEKGKLKERTTMYEIKTNFKKNDVTEKYQLSNAIFKAKVEGIKDGIKDVFEINYIYYAAPLNNIIDIDNNINLNKDIFDLNIDYNPEYWKNHEILPLTDQMQEFINKVNSTSKNSEFRSKSNIK
jgi:hypothetical protein